MDRDGYHAYLVSRGLKGKTIRIYERWVRVCHEWAASLDFSLREATPTMLQCMADAVLPASHSSRGQAVAALRHWYDWQERYDPPLRAIRVPKAPEMRCKAVEPFEARDLVKISQGWWPHGAAVLAGLFLGLRRAEIAAMEWGRFTDQGRWYTVTGKYDKTATLPVHRLMWDEFAPHMSTGWVFPGRFDTHVADATVWEWVRQVGEEVGLDGLRTHQLRHTALATANDETGDLRSVQTFARHSKPSTTAGYTRTTNDRLRATSDALDYLG